MEIGQTMHAHARAGGYVIDVVHLYICMFIICI